MLIPKRLDDVMWGLRPYEIRHAWWLDDSGSGVDHHCRIVRELTPLDKPEFHESFAEPVSDLVNLRAAIHTEITKPTGPFQTILNDPEIVALGLNNPAFKQLFEMFVTDFKGLASQCIAPVNLKNTEESAQGAKLMLQLISSVGMMKKFTEDSENNPLSILAEESVKLFRIKAFTEVEADNYEEFFSLHGNAVSPRMLTIIKLLSVLPGVITSHNDSDLSSRSSINNILRVSLANLGAREISPQDFDITYNSSTDHFVNVWAGQPLSDESVQDIKLDVMTLLLAGVPVTFMLNNLVTRLHEYVDPRETLIQDSDRTAKSAEVFNGAKEFFNTVGNGLTFDEVLPFLKDSYEIEDSEAQLVTTAYTNFDKLPMAAFKIFMLMQALDTFSRDARKALEIGRDADFELEEDRDKFIPAVTEALATALTVLAMGTGLAEDAGVQLLLKTL